jgi:protein kinase A
MSINTWTEQPCLSCWHVGTLTRCVVVLWTTPRVALVLTFFSGDSQNFQRYPPPRPTELPGIFGATYDASEDQYAPMFRDFVYPPRSDDMTDD